jgi:2-polyprenyl-3-methyl-5-hydroxy-6-metoxy-1,4-benzoquinol methylase
MSLRSALARLWSASPLSNTKHERGRFQPCPACGADSPQLFDGSRSPRLLICPGCRHLYWERTPSAQELDRFYRDDYGEAHGQVEIQEGNRAYYRDHVHELVNLAGRPIQEACLIDYGSSIPTLIREAKACGVGRPIAVDLDRLAFEYAHEHGLEILTPTEYGDQIAEGSVDIIRFSHVLEHMVDPKSAIEQASSKLRVGGILYITQPGFPVFLPRQTDYVLKDSVFPKHLHFFSPISLVKMTKGFHLRVEKLFSVARSDEVYNEVAPLLDLDYARRQLRALAEKGEDVRGVHANYPFFTGENSALYLRKTA